MTQLYVGNLSAEGDEKSIRMLFGKYGPVREVLMKSGYAFVEFESPIYAEEAMRELNGSDILGHPMIVEPSHQQRLSSRRKIQHGKVEVTDIPVHFTIQNVESYMSQIGQVLKMEIEETEFGMKKILVTYETQEQAQRAATILGEGNDLPRVHYHDPGHGMNGMRSAVTTRKGSPGLPTQQAKNNTDFPLRILVPSDMVGAIIGKDGATIRMITQLTKARVDVHRRENLGTAEKAITTIGPPECCTEACYQIMKIMQNELLMTNGMMETGKFHEPLPVVPLKILAHNELVGRVIGKGGGTLKRIMAESGTKITISKLKDLTAFNMERTITILGTIDNCKKAESLISAKLRASYESDMAQFIPEQGFGSTLSPSPTNVPAPPLPGSQGSMGLSSSTDFSSRPPTAQSLPATPSAANVRTFTDYSGEHTRLTTLHGSTGALEVNNLGGFKLGSTSIANGTSKFASALESSIDGIVRTNSSVSVSSAGMNEFSSGLNVSLRNTPRLNSNDHLGLVMSKPASATNMGSINSNGIIKGINQFHSGMVPGHGIHVPPVLHPGDGLNEVDDMADVFTGLSFKEPSMIAAPGYGRTRPRRSSAPVGEQGGFGAIGPQNGYGLWGNGGSSENPLPEVSKPPNTDFHVPTSRNSPTQQFAFHMPTSRNSPTQQFASSGGSYSAGIGPNPTFSQAWVNGTHGSNGGPGNVPVTKVNIWSQGTLGNGSRPSSQNSTDSSIQSSPIYSPTNSFGSNGITSENVPTSLGIGMNPLGVGLGEDRGESRSPFRASVPTPLTTVAETITTNGGRTDEDDFYPSFVNDLLGDAQPAMIPPISVGFQW